jgi:hypothetical protein
MAEFRRLKLDEAKELASKWVRKHRYNEQERTEFSVLINSLYVQGLSTTEIAKILGMRRTSVWLWMKRHNIARRKWQEAVSNVCDLSLSPTLAYILGLRYGDLKVVKHHSARTISLVSKDKELVVKFRDSILKIVRRKRGKTTRIWKTVGGYYGTGTYYGFTVYCRKLYEYLKLPLEVHGAVIEKFPCDFLEGFFDSEGSVTKYYKERGQCLRLSNNNFRLLRYVAKLLENQGIRMSLRFAKFTKTGNLNYELYTSNPQSLRNFMEKIGFSILRKQHRLVDRFGEMETPPIR